MLPGQGAYWDPDFIEEDGVKQNWGYCTDLITQKSINWLKRARKQPEKPFFLMCHHKAPHRKWECHPRHAHLYEDEIRVPESFDDDYKNRAQAAAAAKMRIATDMDYTDLGLAQPEGGREVGESIERARPGIRKVPFPEDVTEMRLLDRNTGEVFTFKTREELRKFKVRFRWQAAS